MKIPECVNILGIPYKVIEVDIIENNPLGMGRIYEDSQTIYLRNNLAPEKKLQTFIHEVVHGIIFEIGIADILKNKEEVVVQALAAGIYQVFKQNELN